MIFRLCHPEGDSDRAIRKAVERMLAACDILRPPTPIETLLAFRRLTTAEQAELVPNLLVNKLKRTASHYWKKLQHRVAGFLNIPERHIAVSPGLHRHHRHFLKFHEVGHEVLPWHRDLFVVTAVSDLRMDVRRVLEAEANCFAGHAIFQNGHIAHGYRGTVLRMVDLAGLAAEYGASLSATARQYVTVQDMPTALIIGRSHGDVGAKSILFREAVANTAFLRMFGSSLLGDGFASDHETTIVLNVPEMSVSQAELAVLDLRGDSRTLLAETMFTGYCTLTLLHVRESRPAGSATRRILSLARRRRATAVHVY